MPDFFLHNTLTGKKEKFIPIDGKKVRMYVCGITPYDETHLGHARCYVVFDVLKRALRAAGYGVDHVQNFTDIDDKIIDRAKTQGIAPSLLAERNIESYFKSMAALNVEPAMAYPRVTGSIPEIQAFIKRILDRGHAYLLDGDVYFSIDSFTSYGALSRRNLDELRKGARVEVNERKKNPLDFALWKAAKPGEPSWESPWGPGRPGWHIECSVMSTKALGEEFDIHGGGLDLIFPHHENELAQSLAATGKKFVKFWVHNGFVTVNEEKMSKSLGNFFTLKDILAKFDPMVVRYFLLTQHYRSPLNFSDKDLEAKGVEWRRVSDAYRAATDWYEKIRNKFPMAAIFKEDKANFLPDGFKGALADDLNTPRALADLNGIATLIYDHDDTTRSLKRGLDHPDESSHMRNVVASYFWIRNAFNVLGLTPPKEEAWPPDVLDLVRRREEARKNKQWTESDTLRKKLADQGVLVEDTSAGPRLRRA